MNKMYGFDGEVKAKFSALMLDVFREVFNWLPLAFVIREKVRGGGSGCVAVWVGGGLLAWLVGWVGSTVSTTCSFLELLLLLQTAAGTNTSTPNPIPKPHPHQTPPPPNPTPTKPHPQVFVLHGGLFSRDDVSLDDLRKVHRNQ